MNAAASSDTPILRVWDPAAYRRLAAAVDDDPAPARDEGEALADQDREQGWVPAASPMTLWALLADVARNSARSRAALAACVAHTRAVRGTATLGGGPLVLAPDAEVALIHALGGTEPKDRTTWPAYLVSLAVDLTDADTDRKARGPLAHVRERATALIADTEDEIQDAVVAAYEAGATAGSWSDTDAVTTRQDRVATATDTLDRVVADGRVERAIAIAGAKALPILQSDDDPSAVVAQHFATGLALWREVVRGVVRGAIVPGSRGWRGTLWGLQVAFVAGDHLLVRTGSDRLREATERAGQRAVVSG